VFVYLIRHGQSVNNAKSPDARHIPDAPLTEQGHKQAALAAKYLANEGITHLYCSPLQRTLQTTQPIAEALGLTPEVWPDICEHGGAVYKQAEDDWVNLPGMTRSEILARFDYHLPDTITEEGWWRHNDGLETRELCYARGRKVAEALAQRAQTIPDDALALVTHGTFSDALVRGILHFPDDTSTYFDYQNTGITKISYPHPDAEWQNVALMYHNRVEHLPPELR
jgi:2,3-bisphosphoglycerate-dependent phosphoglycerate mutase